MQSSASASASCRASELGDVATASFLPLLPKQPFLNTSLPLPKGRFITKYNLISYECTTYKTSNKQTWSV